MRCVSRSFFPRDIRSAVGLASSICMTQMQYARRRCNMHDADAIYGGVVEWLYTATQYEYIRGRLSSVGFCIVPLLKCIVPLLKTLRAAPCLFCTNVPIVPLIICILAEIRLPECQRRLILFSSSNYFSYDFIYK